MTIPVEVRRHLGLGGTDKVTFVLEDNGKVELRLVRYAVANLRGIVPALSGHETVDLDDQISEALVERADEIVQRLESG